MSEATRSRPKVDEQSPEIGLTPKQQRILDYFRNHVQQQTYFKSRLVGDELGLSAREIGANITQIQDADTDLVIESWGFSSSTTWKVTK